MAGYSAVKPCLFPAIGNRYSNKTKTFQRVCVTKFERTFGATLAALARGFSDRHFERGEGPGDEVAVYRKARFSSFEDISHDVTFVTSLAKNGNRKTRKS